MPLMPVDRHIERVSKRIGLIPPKATADQAHDMFLAMLEPDEMSRGARQPDHARPQDVPRAAAGMRPLPVAARCRYVNPKAP